MVWYLPLRSRECTICQRFEYLYVFIFRTTVNLCRNLPIAFNSSNKYLIHPFESFVWILYLHNHPIGVTPFPLSSKALAVNCIENTIMLSYITGPINRLSLYVLFILCRFNIDGSLYIFLRCLF